MADTEVQSGAASGLTARPQTDAGVGATPSVLDASGYVLNVAPGGFDQLAFRDLSPFVQGYVEAMARRVVDGVGTRFDFSDLAPETLARIVEDCDDHADNPSFWNAPSRGNGRAFWEQRARGEWANLGFPPLTVALSDAGKVVFQ